MHRESKLESHLMYDLGIQGSEVNFLSDGELIPPPYPHCHPHPKIFKPCATTALRTQKGEAPPVSRQDDLLLQV